MAQRTGLSGRIRTHTDTFPLDYVRTDPYSVRMDSRCPAEMVAANVRTAIADAGLNISDVSHAAHIDESKIVGSTELTFSDLVGVGGVLRVTPDVFFVGVAA